MGIVAKSQVLIADGIHSLSDLVADFVVLFAGHHSKTDADEDHPDGHQRFETAASLVLGTILMIVDAQIEVDASFSVDAGHDMALEAGRPCSCCKPSGTASGPSTARPCGQSSA